MTVRELIEALEEFDDDTEVVIGMKQKYGCDFAMDVEYNIAEHNVHGFYEDNCKAVVITEGEQCGVVDYDNEDGED